MVLVRADSLRPLESPGLTGQYPEGYVATTDRSGALIDGHPFACLRDPCPSMSKPGPPLTMVSRVTLSAGLPFGSAEPEKTGRRFPWPAVNICHAPLRGCLARIKARRISSSGRPSCPSFNQCARPFAGLRLGGALPHLEESVEH